MEGKPERDNINNDNNKRTPEEQARDETARAQAQRIKELEGQVKELQQSRAGSSGKPISRAAPVAIQVAPAPAAAPVPAATPVPAAPAVAAAVPAAAVATGAAAPVAVPAQPAAPVFLAFPNGTPLQVPGKPTVVTIDATELAVTPGTEIVIVNNRFTIGAPALGQGVALRTVTVPLGSIVTTENGLDHVLPRAKLFQLPVGAKVTIPAGTPLFQAGGVSMRLETPAEAQLI